MPDALMDQLEDEPTDATDMVDSVLMLDIRSDRNNVHTHA